MLECIDSLQTEFMAMSGHGSWTMHVMAWIPESCRIPKNDRGVGRSGNNPTVGCTKQGIVLVTLYYVFEVYPVLAP